MQRKKLTTQNSIFNLLKDRETIGTPGINKAVRQCQRNFFIENFNPLAEETLFSPTENNMRRNQP